MTKHTPKGYEDHKLSRSGESSANATGTGLALFIGLAGIAIIMIGAIAALSDDNPDSDAPTPTVIPAPLVDGVVLSEGTILYAEEEVPFSIIAAPDNQNEEQIAEPCVALRVATNFGDGNYFYLDSTGEEPIYWVYAFREDDTNWNGWLPLGTLSSDLGDCETD